MVKGGQRFGVLASRPALAPYSRTGGDESESMIRAPYDWTAGVSPAVGLKPANRTSSDDLPEILQSAFLLAHRREPLADRKAGGGPGSTSGNRLICSWNRAA